MCLLKNIQNTKEPRKNKSTKVEFRLSKEGSFICPLCRTEIDRWICHKCEPHKVVLELQLQLQAATNETSPINSLHTSLDELAL